MLDSKTDHTTHVDIEKLPPMMLLTTDELSKVLGLTIGTLQRWQRLKKGPPITRIEGLPRFLVRDVKAWIQGGSVSSL